MPTCSTSYPARWTRNVLAGAILTLLLLTQTTLSTAQTTPSNFVELERSPTAPESDERAGTGTAGESLPEYEVRCGMFWGIVLPWVMPLAVLGAVIGTVLLSNKMSAGDPTAGEVHIAEGGGTIGSPEVDA